MYLRRAALGEVIPRRLVQSRAQVERSRRDLRAAISKLHRQARRGGLGATAAEISALAIQVASGTAGAAEKYKAALTDYYSASGTYAQAESVIAAAAEPDFEQAPGAAYGGQAPPALYAMESCGGTDYACAQRNAARADANLALSENARRAYNLEVCEYNARITPGVTSDQPCGQFRERVSVPGVPSNSVLQTAVCSGGQCYSPILGETRVVTPGAPAPAAPKAPEPAAPKAPAPAAATPKTPAAGSGPVPSQTSTGTPATGSGPVPNEPAGGSDFFGGETDGLLSGSVDVFGFDVPKVAIWAAAGGAVLWMMKRG